MAQKPPSKTTLERILQCGIVAVIRSERGDTLSDVAGALLAGGVSAIEVTFTVPKAHHVLEQVAASLGDRIVLGAGTILDAETARMAILSGAKFLVSPHVDEGVIEMGRRYSIPVMPGALTPTEVVRAWQAGADVVKIFPSELTGPKYLKALRGPLPQVQLMPTGGITLENAAEFLKCGACALGVGGQLADPKWIADREFGKLEQTARQFVSIVKEFRDSN